MSIKLDKVRQIIREELAAKSNLDEGVDHKSIKSVVAAASNLLKAIESFEKSNLSPEMVNSVGSGLQTLKASLEDMVQTPGSYVPKPEPKKVVFTKG